MGKLRFLLIPLSIMILFSACSRPNTKKLESDYVSMLIDGIGTVGYTSLQSINRAEHAYAALTDDQKKNVANTQSLTEARTAYDTLMSVPKKGRIDRSKFQIGAYRYRQSLWNDTDMQKFTDAGLSLITGAPYNEELLDLCQKHGVGTFLNHTRYIRNDKDKTLEAIDNAYVDFIDHPAIWAMDLIDEPNAADLPGIGEAVEKVETLFPAGLCYINLFPNYASSSQLGSDSYEEHVDAYVQNVGTDYISYDHYMYSNPGGRFFSNLQIVADACRATGRDVWIVLEVSNTSELLNDRQMRVQAYSSMCYGTKLISWACWTYGWFEPDLQIVDSQGNYTPMYEDLKSVNKEILKVSEEYMKFQNIATFPIGDVKNETLLSTALSAFSWEGQDVFTQLSFDDNGCGVAGYFEKNDGSEYALLVTNTTDIMGGEGENAFSFAAPFATSVSAFVNGEKTTLTPDENGIYSVVISNCGGSFITVKRDEAAAFRAEVKAYNAKSTEAPVTLQPNSSAVGFGAIAVGFENDVDGLASLGVEFIIANSASPFLSDHAEKNIGLYAADYYHRDIENHRIGKTITQSMKYGSYSEFAKYFQENSGLIISGNDIADIEGHAKKAPGDFYVMYSPCFKYSGTGKLLSRNYLGALATAGKYSAENGKALWIMLDTADAPETSDAAPSPKQLEWEIWSAFTFGAKKVIFQSYEALKNDPALYTAAQKTIADIKMLAPIYSNYEYIGIYSKNLQAYSPKVSIIDETILERMPSLKAIDTDGIVLIGMFTGVKGSAMMLLSGDMEELEADASTPRTVTLTLDGTEKTVTAYIGGEPTVLNGSGGVYTVSLTGPEGVFVTIE